MFKLGKPSPFEEEIEKATNENNLTEDWSLIMQICDNTINYQDGAKFCIKAIMKRLHHNVPNVVIQTLTLLDACVKNCDKRFLLQVASNDFIQEVRKLLVKMHPSAAMKIKELIQKWSLEEFKDDPELCIIPAFYYKLKSEGTEFPSAVKEKMTSAPICTDPDAVTSQQEENDIIKALEISLKDTGMYNNISIDSGSIGPEFSTNNLCEPFKVRTLYDFEAAEDNELSIKAGEIVTVLDNSNANWWKGSNHRGEGLFPSNFVTKDLEAIPEETTIQESCESDTMPDTTFSGEVKLNEDKIETVICWLNETDPTVEVVDPADMLRLEDEVNKMAPLIEDNLQAIDKRLATLNLVNEKIMASFDLFHSLSDNWSSLPSNLKYSAEDQSFRTMPLPQQLPPTSIPSFHPGQQPFQTQPIMYIPVATPTQQFPSLSNQSSTNIRSEFTSPTSSDTNISLQKDLPSASNSSISMNTANSVHTSVREDQVPHGRSCEAMLQSYPMNIPGGFYLPQPLPMPYAQLSADSGSNLQSQGCAQGGSMLNFLNIPYPSQQIGMGQYFPFPYYYPGSNPVQMPPQTSSQGEALTKSESASEENAANTSRQQYSTYSDQLQAVSLQPSIPTRDHDLNQDPLSELNNSGTIDPHTPLEPVQVSKQT